MSQPNLLLNLWCTPTVRSVSQYLLMESTVPFGLSFCCHSTCVCCWQISCREERGAPGDKFVLVHISQVKTMFSKLILWEAAAAASSDGACFEREVLVENSVDKFLCRIYFCQFNCLPQLFSLNQRCLTKKKKMTFLTKSLVSLKVKQVFWGFFSVSIKTVAEFRCVLIQWGFKSYFMFTKWQRH